ncbi:DUF4124 domain-containing protein [Pseudomonas sp. CGJS7]|uniref:DUF4124 domain-containing protein n=1 Tax=Pseudomonas sp. CGJS7 TaxID=3109348 RepID=UPI00300A9CD7
MNRARSRRNRLVPAALAGLLLSGSAQAADVLIYRCTDERGQLSLRDTPCAHGQQQQTVTMTRPVDPPPRPAPAVIAAPPPAPAVESRPRTLLVRTPQPLYDCVRPDGSTYTSSNGDGNPRMMPIVDLGYGIPYYPDRGTSLGNRIGAPTPRLGDPSARIAVSGRHGNVQYAATARSGGYYAGGYDYGYGVYYGSQLVRDECRQLPQREVCSRLRDQRYQGDRRYNSALQSERAQITQEQRVIDAQLNDDCGAY